MRLFIKIARQRGIPSVLIVDGTFIPIDPAYLTAGFPRRGFRKFLEKIAHGLRQTGLMGTGGAELIFAVNETWKDGLIENGAPPDRIRVVGSPEYDALAEKLRGPCPCDCVDLRKRFGLSPSRPIVLYAHQHLLFGEQLERLIVELWKGCQAAGADLLVKFHPRSGERVLRGAVGATCRGLPRDQTAFILEDCTPFEAVFLSSTVVTVHSTITLDALACRRPMVLMPFLAEGNPLNYAKQYGVAVDVHCVEELADAVASVAGDERVRQRLLANFSAAIDRELHGLDGTTRECHDRRDRTIDRVATLTSRGMKMGVFSFTTRPSNI